MSLTQPNSQEVGEITEEQSSIQRIKTQRYNYKTYTQEESM